MTTRIRRAPSAPTYFYQPTQIGTGTGASAPTPPEVEISDINFSQARPVQVVMSAPGVSAISPPAGYAIVQTPPPEAGEDKRETARRRHQWLSKNWTVEDGGQWEDRALAAERERDEARSLYASTREKQHEVELALIAQRDAALADAARMREALRDLHERVCNLDTNTATGCGETLCLISAYPSSRLAHRANAALAAPAAKEGER